jgi:RecA/RadA recombinase
MKAITFNEKGGGFLQRITIITGYFGSGKTEIAINLALQETLKYEHVAVNDLDVVNPYFRSRDLADLFRLYCIDLISPKGRLSQTDLPIVSGEFFRVLHDPDYRIIIDAGGDKEGALVLGQYYHEWLNLKPEMLFVLNRFRPEVSTLEGALEAVKRIEDASRLKVTGIINNANIGEATTMADIYKGFDLCSSLAEMLNVPVVCTCISSNLRNEAEDFALAHKVKFIKRYLKLPWEGRELHGKQSHL